MLKQLEFGIRQLVEEFIASGKPCPSNLSIVERRNGYIASTVLAGHSLILTEEFVDELMGFELKIFKPTRDPNLPITIYFHGGCFISGGFETHEQQLRQLAVLSNSIVICIKYRLAPEHRYPAAHDDVYNAVLAIKEFGAKYGGDSEQIIFVGDSAGAQLALITSLRLKKQQRWLPNKQIFIYPMLDPKGQSASYASFATDYIITAKMLLSGFAMYVGELDQLSIDENPELNPLLCADFTGLPPTSIITAEFDPLRDEGEQLCKQLLAQGVDAHCERYLGVIHGFFQLSGVSQSAVRCIQSVAKEISDTRYLL